jgi:divalent metal cation (Fe/Co/Zn/Cd) transporter
MGNRRAIMSSRIEERSLNTAKTSLIRARSDDVRLALLLTYITLAWMTVEGAASLWLGWASKSLLLEAFGIDSVVELFSASVLLWRLRIEASGKAEQERLEAVEQRASRLVGYTLYFLVLYVLFNSGYGLFVKPRVTDTHESAWGILIGLVAKIGMPILAGYKLRVAARLNSRALRADAIEAITCGYRSIVLMVGLAATRILGWWWLDSVAALALIPFLIKEARAAIKGEDDCCGGCIGAHGTNASRDNQTRTPASFR